MNSRLKIFGMALVAVVAVSAMSAPGAMATAKQFHSEANPTFGTGEEITKGEFELPGTGVSTCELISETAAGVATQTQVEGTGAFSGCTIGGAHTIVDVNGCKLVFTVHTGTTSTGGAATHTHGPAHVSCPSESEITMTVTAFGFNICTIHIPPQTPTSPTVDYKNVGAGSTRAVEATSTVTGITVVATNTGGGCNAGVHHNGSLRGSARVKGYSDSKHTKQVGVWVE